MKLIEVDRVEEQEVGKILNKRKIKGIIKYLVCWKRFIAGSNMQKINKDLENVRKAVAEFQERLSVEVRR